MDDSQLKGLGLCTETGPAPMFFSSRARPQELVIADAADSDNPSEGRTTWWDENDADERAAAQTRTRFDIAAGAGAPRTAQPSDARAQHRDSDPLSAAARANFASVRPAPATGPAARSRSRTTRGPAAAPSVPAASPAASSAASPSAPATRSRSQSTRSFVESPGGGIKQVPLINLEDPSPYLWTIGVGILITLILVCEILQSGGFKSITKNPMYGPDDSTMLQMGAKYGPLILDGEVWRLFSAILVQNGLIYYAVTVFLLFFTRKIERDTGFWRTFIIFALSGTYGYIVSSLFVPSDISCGATGAMFGYLGLMLFDLCASWRQVQRPGFRLMFLIVIIVILLAVGLTPYVDNFVHVGGFIIGVLYALMLLPNVGVGKCSRCCHGLVAFLSFPVMSVLFMITLVVFYREVVDDNWCSWCHYINCVNISNWCPPK